MKNRKDTPISFGVTLTSGRSKNPGHDRTIETDFRANAAPVKPEVMPHEIDCPRMKQPLPGKPPFTPDMFNCDSARLPSFPPQEKMSGKEERIQQDLKRCRCRTASHYTSEKSSSMVVPFVWGFFKVVFIGVFVFFKYAFIAVAVILTIGCMICAGRKTTGLR